MGCRDWTRATSTAGIHTHCRRLRSFVQATTNIDIRHAPGFERQLDALGKHGIPDQKTGATIDRAGFTELLRYARSGDTIVATNLDRF